MRLSYALLVCFLFSLVALPAAADENRELADQCQKRVHTDAKGISLLYRLYVPKNYDAKKKYPLILFLHGSGERGNDNQRQLLHPDVMRLVNQKDKAKTACFLVAPQCPAAGQAKDSRWVMVDWSAETHATPKGPSDPIRLTLEVLDLLEKEFSIDPARRYITGLSMGGYGTYDILLRRPRYFAAAIPICGGADNSRAAELAKLPMWIFHGSNDGAVPVTRSRTVVEAMKKAGGHPKYTEYQDLGHLVWKRAYGEPELADWLFRQHR